MEHPCHHTDANGNETCSKPGEPNVCSEGDWALAGKRGWKDFLMITGGSTDGGLFNGRLECPCFRNHAFVQDDMQYASAPVSSSTRNDIGVDKVNNTDNYENVVITYIPERGWVDNPDPILGWNFTGCAFDASCRFTEEMWQTNQNSVQNGTFHRNDTTIAKAIGPNGALRALLPHVHYAFYNRGLWGALKREVSDRIMKSLYDWTGGDADSSARCFFQSTTGSERTRQNNLDEIERHTIRRSAFEAGCEFFDVMRVTEELGHMQFKHPMPPRRRQFKYHNVFWDAVHYQPWVYEEINNLRLNVLCNTKLL